MSCSLMSRRTFTLIMSEAEKVELDTIRRAMGARSSADVVRTLIRRHVDNSQDDLGHHGPKDRDRP